MLNLYNGDCLDVMKLIPSGIEGAEVGFDFG
jgi:hypothetical protein